MRPGEWPFGPDYEFLNGVFYVLIILAAGFLFGLGFHASGQ